MREALPRASRRREANGRLARWTTRSHAEKIRRGILPARAIAHAAAAIQKRISANCRLMFATLSASAYGCGIAFGQKATRGSLAFAVAFRMSDAPRNTPPLTVADVPQLQDTLATRPRFLPRRIGFWTGVAILVGSTIGSGIFRSPAGIADKVPGPLPFLSVWVVGGLFALCGALTLAEAASAFPQTGGVYVFVREAWGRLAAFLFGWSELVMIRAASLGAISTTFSEYFIRVTGQRSAARAVQWVRRITSRRRRSLSRATFNYIGVRAAGTVQNVTTLAKVGGLLRHRRGVRPWSAGDRRPLHSGRAPGKLLDGAFGLALVSVLWVYDGWADVSFVAGEVENPRRNLPRILIIGTAASSSFICWRISPIWLCCRSRRFAIRSLSPPTLLSG